ncbi:phosphate ABC transporter permease PstA [Mycobacterium vicinigordonae]|uniref:Phosphate transport system permease protein PstA n=1 Tax=Mycobacterium vicinigordonae TaxID=1719132 RepID=A0A7D6E468_9MYCO|nr:phosphate ABC transporter permease PstA [Mycobacterium vicinigordonae]QLL06882.1 phosphate ABC transporter permease PstA [Mycobacterium vicinigordonae]
MTSILDRPLKWRRISGISRRRRLADSVATVLVTLAMLIALTPLIWVLCSVVARGFRSLSSSVWWTHSQAGTTALEPGGGAYHAIVGTLLLGLMCAAISIPIGVLVGIYLVEYGGSSPLGRLVTFTVDVLAGVPSMVAALFIYSVWVSAMGLPRSEFAVALALVLLMLPVIARATEEMLRIVPVDLREASYALGITKWKTITRVVLPTGRSGILTGILLALARVLGETSPLLILVGYSRAINFDVFSGFVGTLPGMMYYQTTAGAGANQVSTDRLWGAALTLIVLIGMINVGARVVAKIVDPRSRS